MLDSEIREEVRVPLQLRLFLLSLDDALGGAGSWTICCAGIARGTALLRLQSDATLCFQHVPLPPTQPIKATIHFASFPSRKAQHACV